MTLISVDQPPRESNTPLMDFLQTLLPILVGLPTDYPPLEIERAHQALAPAPAPDKPLRSILVEFLRYSQRIAILRAALKKCNINHGGFQLWFYTDPSDSDKSLTPWGKNWLVAINIKDLLIQHASMKGKFAFLTPVSLRLHSWRLSSELFSHLQCYSL